MCPKHLLCQQKDKLIKTPHNTTCKSHFMSVVKYFNICCTDTKCFAYILNF